MTTLDILICTLNKGIVRISDNLLSPCDGIHYVVCFQYTESRFLELIPEELTTRSDITFVKYQGMGLSANRNSALKQATSDLVIFADDDARFNIEELHEVVRVMDSHKDVDVAFFQASTYTGRLLKDYPSAEMNIHDYIKKVHISAIEMVCRREKIQNKVFFDERFGLGTKFLTCGEEVIWLLDALKMGLSIKYFPYRMVATSTMLKQRLVYIDVGVQRAKGAISYYREGIGAWWTCFKYASRSAFNGYCHFVPMMRHLAQGICYIQRTKGNRK